MRPGFRLGSIGLLALVAVASAMAARLRAAGVGAGVADRVLGQIDFIKSAPNFVDAIGMNAPAGVAIDKAAGHVIVADTQNNRVLGWKSEHAFATGGAADLVIGQPDLIRRDAIRCAGAVGDELVPADRSRGRRAAQCLRRRCAK